MNYSSITKAEVANGIGVRVVLWVSGCDHHCKGCQNIETWDANNGKPFTQETHNKIIELLDHEYVSGLTFSGGDPLRPQNVRTCMMIAKSVKQKFPSKDIWCWTGYRLEELKNRNDRDTDSFLDLIDYIVDGEFIENLKDISLHWRGSSNQRIYKNINGIFVDVTNDM